MTATAPPRARISTQGADVSVDTFVRTLAVSGVQVLAFSIPYMWLWTAGLDSVARFFTVVAHGIVLLAIGAASAASDRVRGLSPRLMLRPQEAGPDDAARAGSWTDLLTLLSIAAIAALLAAPVGWMLPASIAALFVIGALWARAPLWIKYLGVGETAAPLAVMGLPAGAIFLSGGFTPPLSSLIAGASALSAIVLATHLRDRELDLADDVPTAATRQPETSENWLRTLAFAAGIAVLVGIEVPLDAAEALGVTGAVGFVAATAAGTWRVPAMVGAHMLIGAFWILA